MRCQGHTEPAGLAKGPFPIQGSLEVKVSSRMGGQISRSEHVTELTPLVCFAFPSAPSSRPFGDIANGWEGTGRLRWAELLQKNAARVRHHIRVERPQPGVPASEGRPGEAADVPCVSAPSAWRRRTRGASGRCGWVHVHP